MCHVPSIRGTGVDKIIKIVDKIPSYRDNDYAGLLENVVVDTETEMNREAKKNGEHCLVCGTYAGTKGINK